MVYDRTLADVLSANQIYAEKVQNGIELTDDDIETLKRGRLTTETINRIEAKQAELKTILNEMGYYNTPVVNKQWLDGESFLLSDMERLTGNTAILREAFFVPADAPENPVAKYHFEELNKMEKILVLIQQMSETIKGNYRICGTFYCGG